MKSKLIVSNTKYEGVLKLISQELKSRKKKFFTQEELFFFLTKKKLMVSDENADSFFTALVEKGFLKDSLSKSITKKPTNFLANEFKNVNLSHQQVRKLFNEKIQDSQIRSKISYTNDIIKWYMQWIGKYGDLLNHDQEIMYAKRMEKGDEKAKSILVNHNLRLVVNVAKRYKKKGLPFMDLISEGNAGLLKAVCRYQWQKGFRLATYAVWWIRQTITRAAADQARLVRVPVHMVETINKLIKLEHELHQEYGRKPTDKEIAKRFGSDWTTEKVMYIRRINIDPISLDKTIGKEEDSSISDFIKDDSTESPVEYSNKSDLKRIVNNLLDNSLIGREKEIIKMHYGIGKDKNGERMRVYSLDEIADYFQISRERIRQIESKAIRRLRLPQRKKQISEFILNY